MTSESRNSLVWTVNEAEESKTPGHGPGVFVSEIGVNQPRWLIGT